MATTQLTADTFRQAVESAPTLLVDFWAGWCGPCLRFAPVFERASEQHPDITFGKVDTEAEQALSAGLGISSIPTLMAFRDGILLHAQAGALPPQTLDELIAAVRAVDMDDVRRQLAEQEQQRERQPEHGQSSASG